MISIYLITIKTNKIINIIDDHDDDDNNFVRVRVRVRVRVIDDWKRKINNDMYPDRY